MTVVNFPKSNVVQFPTAKPEQGYLDISIAGGAMSGFAAELPTTLAELFNAIVNMVTAAGSLIRYEPEDPEKPIEDCRKGVLEVYRAGPGMRGLDGMLPASLTDKIIRLIKAAGVPVRFEAPKEWSGQLA